RAWFAREVEGRLRPGGRDALARHRRAGDRLVLATSGLVYAARAAVAAYGLDGYVATVFEVASGRFTGKLDTLAIGPGKERAAPARHSATTVATPAASAISTSATAGGRGASGGAACRSGDTTSSSESEP